MTGSACIQKRHEPAKRLRRRDVAAMDLALDQHRRRDGDEITVEQLHRADHLAEVVFVGRPGERRFIPFADLQRWEIVEPAALEEEPDPAFRVAIDPAAVAAQVARRGVVRLWVPPGVHDNLPATRYHHDPCESPSLSAGTIKTLLTHSPLLAWWNHPRLNPQWEPTFEAKFDVGTAAHELLLKGDDIAEWIDAEDWRTKAAREQRDAARREGKVPLLARQRDGVMEMVAAVREQVACFEIDPPLFAAGKPEQTIVWEEDGVCCRARADWLRDDMAAIDDAKSTAQSASPHEWPRRTFWSIGCDVQAAWYTRGLEAVTGRTAAFRFVTFETDPPHGLSVFDLAPSALDLAHRKIEWALRTWRECLASGEWPGYERQVASVELSAWADTAFIERAGLEAYS